MIASLLASAALIGTVYGWGYTPGAAAKFKIKLPDGSQFMNVTPPTPYDIGSKFNITVEVQSVTAMSAFGVTVVWNSTFCQFTGNYWMSPVMFAELLAGRWTSSFLGFWSNDTAPATVPNVGVFDGYGQTALYPNSLTGTYELVILEFQVMSYGPSGFYLLKDKGPLETAYAALGLTPSGWMTATTPYGESEPYDVVWWVEPEFNAEMYVVPEFPAHLFMALFLIATMIAVVLAKTVWSKKPRGRVDVK